MEYENFEQVRCDHPTWFCLSTMRFFGSIIESDLIGGKYFVTSEKFSENHQRLFTVRKASKMKIHTIGDFQSHSSVHSALKAIHKQIIESLPNYGETISTRPST